MLCFWGAMSIQWGMGQNCRIKPGSRGGEQWLVTCGSLSSKLERKISSLYLICPPVTVLTPRTGIVTGNRRPFCSYEQAPVASNVRSRVSGIVLALRLSKTRIHRPWNYCLICSSVLSVRSNKEHLFSQLYVELPIAGIWVFWIG